MKVLEWVYTRLARVIILPITVQSFVWVNQEMQLCIYKTRQAERQSIALSDVYSADVLKTMKPESPEHQKQN